MVSFNALLSFATLAVLCSGYSHNGMHKRYNQYQPHRYINGTTSAELPPSPPIGTNVPGDATTKEPLVTSTIAGGQTTTTCITEVETKTFTYTLGNGHAVTTCITQTNVVTKTLTYDTPTVPGPTTPAGPGSPGNPASPTAPGNPGKPETPGTPASPSGPGSPSYPGGPGNPGAPSETVSPSGSNPPAYPPEGFSSTTTSTTTTVVTVTRKHPVASTSVPGEVPPTGPGEVPPTGPSVVPSPPIDVKEQPSCSPVTVYVPQTTVYVTVPQTVISTVTIGYPAGPTEGSQQTTPVVPPVGAETPSHVPYPPAQNSQPPSYTKPVVSAPFQNTTIPYTKPSVTAPYQNNTIPVTTIPVTSSLTSLPASSASATSVQYVTVVPVQY